MVKWTDSWHSVVLGWQVPGDTLRSSLHNHDEAQWSSLQTCDDQALGSSEQLCFQVNQFLVTLWLTHSWWSSRVKSTNLWWLSIGIKWTALFSSQPVPGDTVVDTFMMKLKGQVYKPVMTEHWEQMNSSVFKSTSSWWHCSWHIHDEAQRSSLQTFNDWALGSSQQADDTALLSSQPVPGDTMVDTLMKSTNLWWLSTVVKSTNLWWLSVGIKWTDPWHSVVFRSTNSWWHSDVKSTNSNIRSSSVIQSIILWWSFCSLVISSVLFLLITVYYSELSICPAVSGQH